MNEKEQVEAPLSTLEETSELQDLVFIDKNTNEPIDFMMAVYKENKPGARSDYENCIDDFHAIDETYSNLMNLIRKSSPKSCIRSIIKESSSKI